MKFKRKRYLNNYNGLSAAAATTTTTMMTMKEFNIVSILWVISCP
jgi:hypothetical protein